MSVFPRIHWKYIYHRSNTLVPLFSQVNQVLAIVEKVFNTAVEISIWVLRVEVLICSNGHLWKENMSAWNYELHWKHTLHAHLINQHFESSPGHSPSGWTMVGSPPTLCFCPRWGWSDCCVAPPRHDASVGRPTGCPETQDAVWNSSLEFESKTTIDDADHRLRQLGYCICTTNIDVINYIKYTQSLIGCFHTW